MNSTETPGGSGIPAGWYDDPSGQGLRWWDGDRWTEHVHTAESAVAAADGTGSAGEQEAPPPELVKLRETIRARGAKGVGIVLGAIVLVIVVVALLVSGGAEDKGTEPGAGAPTTGKAVVSQQEIKQLRRQLKNSKLPKAEKKSLEAELKKLEGQAGKAGGSGKGAKDSKQGSGKQAKAGE